MLLLCNHASDVEWIDSATQIVEMRQIYAKVTNKWVSYQWYGWRLGTSQEWSCLGINWTFADYTILISLGPSPHPLQDSDSFENKISYVPWIDTIPLKLDNKHGTQRGEGSTPYALIARLINK